MKVALEIYKESSALRFTLIHTFSCVSKSRKSTCVQCLIECVHLQNEWVINPFRKHPKSCRFVSIKSSLYGFYRNSKISRNSSHRYLWNFAQQKTFIQRIRSAKHFKRKCRTGLKFDLELKPLWRHCHVTFIPITQCKK